jgi:hypothetical protein
MQLKIATICLFAALNLLSASCRDRQSKMPQMTRLEEESYLAIGAYLKCLGPYIEEAKTNPEISDKQVEELGFQCKPLLHYAAVKKERYFSEEGRANEDHPVFYAKNRSERVMVHERELAEVAWCDLRDCGIID